MTQQDIIHGISIAEDTNIHINYIEKEVEGMVIGTKEEKSLDVNVFVEAFNLVKFVSVGYNIGIGFQTICTYTTVVFFLAYHLRR